MTEENRRGTEMSERVNMREEIGNVLVNPSLHFIAGILMANVLDVSNEMAYVFIGILIVSHAIVYWVNHE